MSGPDADLGHDDVLDPTRLVTIEDLGTALRYLRRRQARRDQTAELTYRELERITGYRRSVPAVTDEDLGGGDRALGWPPETSAVRETMTGMGPQALWLISGDEELLVGRAVDRVVAESLAGDPQTEVREVDAATVSPGELAELFSPSLFGGARVVVVRPGQDAGKDAVATILAFARDPDPDVRLVVTHAGGAKGKALADGLAGAGASVIPAAKLTRHRERIDFVRSDIARLGGKCSEEAADALIAAVGNDLRDLAAAAAQLVADTDGTITPAVVGRYYRGKAEVSGFAVADAAMVGDVPGALEALRWALAIGVDPVPIADALADGVRTVSRVAAAGRGSPYQLAAALGMPPWKVERAQRQARGWTPAALARAMHAAAACNAEVKGASEDRGYALERAVFAFAAARADAARADAARSEAARSEAARAEAARPGPATRAGSTTSRR